MNTLVTGGAGFIGRWLVKRLLSLNHSVTVIDDLSNGKFENIKEFESNSKFNFIRGDIRDLSLVSKTFKSNFDCVYHLAAEINVQKSLDDPQQTFQKDVVGTFNVLEQCRVNKTKFIFMSSCMVYDQATDDGGISEEHPVKPSSPYAAAKLSGEFLTISYFYSYNLPTVVLRPFNTYGPFQKTNGEGGVISIFLEKTIRKEKIHIYGNGEQTRDFLFVEDCIDFILRASQSEKAEGQIFNAGTGDDISINELAKMIIDEPKLIKHINHIHPQSEIMKLKCNFSKARKILNWKPKFSLKEGLEITKKWISEQQLV